MLHPDPAGPDTGTNAYVFERRVDLNAGRRAEKEEGHVRYLRPTYQTPRPSVP